MTAPIEGQSSTEDATCRCRSMGYRLVHCSLHQAAPELLTELQEARWLIEFWHGKAGWDIYQKASPEMKRIDAVIAKAKGEQP